MPVSFQIRLAAVGLAFTGLSLLGGCDASRAPLQGSLEVQRQGWDTLQVELRLAAGTNAGREPLLSPTDTTVVLFDAHFDTLFSGSSTTIPVPDVRLGDQEWLVVEACVQLEGRSLCEQQTLPTSPKRIRLDSDLTYPLGSDFDRGRYQFDFVVERQRYGEETWEPIPLPPSFARYVLAYVEAADAEPVRIPLEGGRGRFDLRGYDNHADFDYYLRSRLREAREAAVRFDVYAGLGEQTERLASLEKRVRLKTRDERAEEVAHYVRQAAEQLVERHERFERARVYIDAWSYDEARDRYRVELEIWGRTSSFRRYRMRGTLEVSEDGTEAVFHPEAEERRRRRRDRDRDEVERPRPVPLQPLAPPGLAPDSLGTAPGRSI